MKKANKNKTKTGYIKNVGVNKPIAKSWADAIHPKNK
ncbi:hypothetical protein PANI_CDS0010 [Maribacter phage Panino]